MKYSITLYLIGLAATFTWLRTKGKADLFTIIATLLWPVTLLVCGLVWACIYIKDSNH